MYKLLSLKLILIFVGAFLPTVSFADVYVDGDIYGNYCKFTVLCGDEKIDATYDNGVMYTLPNSFKKVSERNGNECYIHINLKSSFWGALAKRATGISPVFYQYKRGPKHAVSSYKKMGTPKYIRFKCY
jgi:hypothetical protein